MPVENEYPRVLYHTAIKRPRNIFGKPVKNVLPIFAGDRLNPHNPDAGLLHYRTMTVAVYGANGMIDLEASKAKEEELAKQGWVRHPNLLKEEYED